MTLTPLLLVLQATTLTVGTGANASFPTIAAAVAAARPGDTVHVTAGVYREHVVVDRPLALLGRRGAVLDGEGTGVVIDIRAPATIRGFVVRGSGHSQAREDAGIRAERADDLVVEDNRLEDVLFGVYVKQSRRVVIRRNSIEGKDLGPPLRGDGIRLWYSHGALVTDNRVRRTRDVVIWFSNGADVRNNVVTEGRYGLHFMYSDDNTFVANTFAQNEVGAFIMYSRRVTFRENVFADARGTTGRGIGFKDADAVVAERNVIVKNAVGISLDNSPHSDGVTNRFRGNTLAFNDVAVALLPSVHSNVFESNTFHDNLTPIRVTGGGHARANTWRANRWSDYAGFDANRDGVGDQPFVFERLSDGVVAKHEALQLFMLSPAMSALNTVGRAFPLLRPDPLLIDSLPLLESPHARTARSSPTWLVPAWLFGAAAAVGALVVQLRRPVRIA